MRRKSTVARKKAQWRFISFLALVLIVNSGGACAQEQAFDRERYYRAVEYCRQYAWPGRLNLSPDRQILCFSGAISQKDMDVSLARDLKENGLFVVRSFGGFPSPAITLSNLVRDRHATVVVYDFCFSACAEYFLIASYQTYVLKATLVAWHNPQSSDPNHPYCSSLVTPRDGEPKRLRRGPCEKTAFVDQAATSVHWPAEIQFFKERTVDPLFDSPPDSLYVRKIVTGLYAEMGVDHDIAWTIHPRYYPQWFKTKIFYEAYPESQNEVDKMLAALGLNTKVIYDP
jgi:hypothetical protein